MIAPNSRIILLKSPIELDNINQITFNNATAQYNYFYGLNKIELINATFQRKDNTLRFPTENNIDFDELQTYNYCMYQNTNYSNKWFYAFINECKYINDGMSEITLKTDVFQTWQFDITYKASFIEREHVSKANDTYHSNLVEENVDFPIRVNAYKTQYPIGDCHPVMATTVSPTDASNVGSGYYGNIYSGCKYYIFESTNYLNNALSTIANAGKSSGIVSIFLAPDFLTGYATATFTNGIAEVKSEAYSVAQGIAVPLNPGMIGEYTPKNKKVFNYPWCYFILSNNSGGDIVLKLENFYQSNPSNPVGYIEIVGTVCPGCSIRAIPQDYEVGDITFSYGNNNQYGLNLGKFPVCSYPNDSYTNWLTQNSLNIPIQVISGGISTATGAMTGSAVGVASGALSIAQTIGSIYEHSIIPPSVEGNINSGDVTYALDLLTFSGYFKTLREEDARILDDYFSVYGYATHKIKVPNTNNRSNWNYVKTVNCNLIGDIPQKDMQELKEMFNNGVTLWHTTTYFLDYSQNNN